MVVVSWNAAVVSSSCLAAINRHSDMVRAWDCICNLEHGLTSELLVGVAQSHGLLVVAPVVVVVVWWWLMRCLHSLWLLLQAL